jgi:predicted ATPase/class 3 adenylate cyclase
MIAAMRQDLPVGTVTFLFTDVEGSTSLLHKLGAAAYADALAEHRRVIREACASQSGVEVDTQGDAFFFAFPTAPGALAAAAAFSDALVSGPIKVRVGLHTGTPLLTEEGYVGEDVHRAARITAAGHGGQVLVSASTATLVELELPDLGEHRLKDLSAPEHVFQLGEGKFPPLNTLHQTNLPIPQTPFLGREKELGEVLDLLSRDDLRLLTLTGPGGTGKTRLAAQAAGARADRYPHGVYWVPLAALRDPELVLGGAAQVLGAKDGLASHIGDKQMLLLFDNFEHVIAAASGLSSLLGECPHLELLVTSREPLHLAGEQEYPVPPLGHGEAVDFFASRARAVVPDFEVDGTVPEICLRLDSLPLALELAAARVKALSTEQILAKLEQCLPLLTGGSRDAPERQRTLRTAIEWSYELLADEEQRLFRRLSVFAGGCTLEAAEEVCEGGVDTLHSLVDKSLLRFSNERYWMLETIREYAEERLDECGESEDLHSRHMEQFLRVAIREGERFRTGAQAEAVARLANDENNLRLALTRLSRTQPARLLDLVSAVRFYWGWVIGAVGEARQLAERALEFGSRAPTELRADALLLLSSALSRQGDSVEAIQRGEEAVTIYRALRSSELGRALVYLGNTYQRAAHYRQAASAYEDAIAYGERARDRHCQAFAMGNFGYLSLVLGDYERARSLFRDAAVLNEELGNQVGFVAHLSNEGLAALRALELDEARVLLGAAMRASVELGYDVATASCLEGFAWIAATGAKFERAARLQGAAEARLAKAGAQHDQIERVIHEETRTAIHAALGEDCDAQLGFGRSLDAGDALEYALATTD